MREHVALHSLARSHALTHQEQRALTLLLASAEGRGTLDADGEGRCPMCGMRVVGEPGCLLTYWHPVATCCQSLADQLRNAHRLLALHGVEVPA